ncbi:hypothetical protein [Fischerella sp. PCC 9605]|nr:hypothetical protein [Fischerella sp. PCC 9605]
MYMSLMAIATSIQKNAQTPLWAILPLSRFSPALWTRFRDGRIYSTIYA